MIEYSVYTLAEKLHALQAARVFSKHKGPTVECLRDQNTALYSMAEHHASGKRTYIIFISIVIYCRMQTACFNEMKT
jgi:hypothetical protein